MNFKAIKCTTGIVMLGSQPLNTVGLTVTVIRDSKIDTQRFPVSAHKSAFFSTDGSREVRNCGISTSCRPKSLRSLPMKYFLTQKDGLDWTEPLDICEGWATDDHALLPCSAASQGKDCSPIANEFSSTGNSRGVN